MSKGRLVMLKRRVTRMTTESKTLEERYEKIEGERSHLLETFQGTVEQVQRKSELKNVRLGERLERVDAEYGTRAQQVRKEKGEGRRGRRRKERKREEGEMVVVLVFALLFALFFVFELLTHPLVLFFFFNVYTTRHAHDIASRGD